MVATQELKSPLQAASLTAFLKAKIAEEGSLSVAAFHEMAMDHEGYGYYRHRVPLGASGDFTTAPELSPLFGEVWGAFLLHAWQRLGEPFRAVMLECGPGRGLLMRDVLRVARLRPLFLKGLSVVFLEVNPWMKKAQAEALASFMDELRGVYWCDTLDSVKQRVSGMSGPLFWVANEFFDVLPTFQYQRLKEGWAERRIHVSQEKVPDRAEPRDVAALHQEVHAYKEAHKHADKQTDFAFTLQAVDQEKEARLNKIAAHYPEGTIYEESPACLKVFRHIVSLLKAKGGLGLVADYGYREPTLAAKGFKGDSWQGLYQGKMVSPLWAPGLVDLSFHVNFKALQAEAGESQVSAQVATLRDFLYQQGLKERVAQLKAQASAQKRAHIDVQVMRLTHPLQMGHLFKVMCVEAVARG